MRFKETTFGLFLFIIIFFPVLSLQSQSDGLVRGAFKMPYIRYEADKGVFGQGAEVRGPSVDQTKIESEASERKYVALTTQGSYVQWSVNEPQKGMTLRFTIPDSADGNGMNGSLSVYLNGKFISEVKLSSYFAYQYFYMTKGNSLNAHPFNDPAVGHPRMRFDEVRFVFPTELKAGDILKLTKTVDDGMEYGVDFIELEPMPAPIQKPAGFVNITESPFNAIPNDTIDDFVAINRALTYAGENNMGVYMPEGKFIVSNQINLTTDGMKLRGAGMWYTELYFTQLPTSTTFAVGIRGKASNLFASDFHITAKANFRGYHNAMGGYWGGKSIIENILITRFSLGMAPSNYLSGEIPQINDDGIRIRNCRIRNNYAGGVNLAKGASNCIVEHCNFRNIGDDGMIFWAQDTTGLIPTMYNTFRFCTVENVYKAAGLACYGGKGHVAHHCIIRDNFAGAGIRANSIFDATPFATDSYFDISEITIERCGTIEDQFLAKIGAIHFDIVKFDVNNINLNCIDVKDSQADGIIVKDVLHKFSLHDINLNDINIINTGANELGSGFGIYVSNLATGWNQSTNVNFQNTKSGDMNESPPTFEIKTIPTSNNRRPIAITDSIIFLASNQSSIVIDGSRSYDPEGKSLSYSWVQIAGKKVNMINSKLSKITMSGLNPKEEYVFKLYVNDSVLSSSKIIYIKPQKLI